MATVSIFLPSMSGTTGNTLWLYKSSDYSLVNTDGDALTESGTSGWFTATVAEAWTVALAATVLDTNSLASGYGWLAVGATQVVDIDLSAVIGYLITIQADVDQLGGNNQLAAITVESGVIGNFPETLTIGDSYTSNTGQIKILVTDSDGDPITTFGSLALEDALIEFTAFRPNDSAVITGTCEFVDDVTETYVLLTLSSIQTSLGVAEYTYEGRLKFFWEGAVSSDSLDSDDEQKTYKTTPFKFISNP